VDLTVQHGRLVITPPRRKKYRLADLLRATKPSQSHGEQFTDSARGKEIW
jgi:antitoxin component of MazEF toxin-antitoxin module